MSMLLSFLGGAATGLSSEIEKAEKSAKEEAMLRTKRMYETYEKVKEDNLKLTNNLKEEAQWIINAYPNATPEQVAFLQGNPPALQALKKMKDPTKIDLSTVINIASTDKPASSIIDDVQAFPEVAEKVTGAIKSAMPAYRSGLGGFIDRVAEGSGEVAENRTARMLGVDVQTMKAMKPLSRPTVAGKFDMSRTLEETPDSVEDMVKAADVQRVQAKEKFGVDSKQYRDADSLYRSRAAEIMKADKKIEDRRDRLELERRDSKDPAVVAALTKEINSLNADIKSRREATSTKSEREGKGEDASGVTLNKATKLMETYMNTDMIANKGLDWRQFQEERVVFDSATQKNITIPGKKANLNPEQEKQYVEGMNAARMQGLKDLGFVSADGKPINNDVKALMTAYGLSRPVASPAPATPPEQGPPPTPAEIARLRAEAKAAIAKGAPADVVAERFRKTTRQEL